MLRQIIFIAVCEFWVQERHERRIAVFQPWSANRPQSKDGTKLTQYISNILKYYFKIFGLSPHLFSLLTAGEVVHADGWCDVWTCGIV